MFVSYSQPDGRCAFEIVSYLESQGIPVWIAPRDIAPSADWAAEIIDAIAASRIMILLLSSASNESPQVRREVERAVHRQVPILPVRIEDVLPTRSMEYFLSAQQWLDAFPPPLSGYYGRLLGQVNTLLLVPEAGRMASIPLAAERPSPNSVFADHVLQVLQSCLAEYVGPIAGFLVRRASRAASSWGDLIERLADEVEPRAARNEFLDSCRDLNSKVL